MPTPDYIKIGGRFFHLIAGVQTFAQAKTYCGLHGTQLLQIFQEDDVEIFDNFGENRERIIAICQQFLLDVSMTQKVPTEESLHQFVYQTFDIHFPINFVFFFYYGVKI